MPSHNAAQNRKSTKKLMGIAEIAEYAQVTRSRAAQIVKEPWFPDFFDHLRMGTCWERKPVLKALRDKGYPKAELEQRPLRDVRLEENQG